MKTVPMDLMQFGYLREIKNEIVLDDEDDAN